MKRGQGLNECGFLIAECGNKQMQIAELKSKIPNPKSKMLSLDAKANYFGLRVAETDKCRLQISD